MSTFKVFIVLNILNVDNIPNIPYIDNMSSSTASRFSHMIGVNTKIGDDDDSSDDLHSMESITQARYNHRFAVERALQQGDFQSLKEAGVVPAQLTMIQLSTDETVADTVRYNASAFILSQNAHGPVAKSETTIDFKKMPRDQLSAIIQSRLAIIQKSDPNFDPTKILPVRNVLNVPRETNDFVEQDDSQVFEEGFEE